MRHDALVKEPAETTDQAGAAQGVKRSLAVATDGRDEYRRVSWK
jgi:hypothetical protein